jgi:hypothetical protein
VGNKNVMKIKISNYNQKLRKNVNYLKKKFLGIILYQLRNQK